MGKIGEPFAPLTRSLSSALNSAPPAAYKLWVHLRQENRLDRAFNFDLAEAASALGYTVRWLREALLKLKDLEFVEVLEQWWGHRYKLRLRLPDLVESGNKTGDRQQENSQIEGSNPDSLVPLDQRSFKRDHDVLPEPEQKLHGEPSAADANDTNDVESIAPAKSAKSERLYADVREVAPDFNPRVLLELLAQFGEQRIRNAIGVIQEQVRRGNTKNSAAYLYTAIVKGFSRRRSDLSRAIPIPNSQSQDNQDSQDTIGDFSGLLVEISIFLRRLGWDRERVAHLMAERYNVRSRHEMSEDDLRDWRDYLASWGDRPGSSSQQC